MKKCAFDMKKYMLVVVALLMGMGAVSGQITHKVYSTVEANQGLPKRTMQVDFSNVNIRVTSEFAEDTHGWTPALKIYTPLSQHVRTKVFVPADAYLTMNSMPIPVRRIHNPGFEDIEQVPVGDGVWVLLLLVMAYGVWRRRIN